MSTAKLAMHYVCTYDEAIDLLAGPEKFWVCNCGCREGTKRQCKRSKHDVCLMFVEGSASGSHVREISSADARKLVEEARHKDLVFRPFRSDDKKTTDGICLCCDDCCGYFVDGNEACDKGRFIEHTHVNDCTNCGECVDMCFFEARKMGDNGRLEISRDACFGCGLCVHNCSIECIEMAPR